MPLSYLSHILQDQDQQKKRHGRPLGSRNCNKCYNCIRCETGGVNLAFENALRNIPITETPELPNEADGSRQESQEDEDEIGMAVLWQIVMIKMMMRNQIMK